MSKTFAVANTQQLIAANERKYKQMNQKMDRSMYDRLDPEGVHVCFLAFPHNDVHPRTMWFVKLKDEEVAQETMIDMTWEDYQGFNRVTREDVDKWKESLSG